MRKSMVLLKEPVTGEQANLLDLGEIYQVSAKSANNPTGLSKLNNFKWEGIYNVSTYVCTFQRIVMHEEWFAKSCVLLLWMPIAVCGRGKVLTTIQRNCDYPSSNLPVYAIEEIIVDRWPQYMCRSVVEGLLIDAWQSDD